MSNQFPEQLFILSDEVVKNLSSDDVDAICHDLDEMGLMRDPFPHYAIQARLGVLNHFTGDVDPCNVGASERLYYRDGACYLQELDVGCGFRRCDWFDYDGSDFDLERRVLIVLLATKGVVQEVKGSKLSLISGKGNGKTRFRYSTTLKLCESVSGLGRDPTGRTCRPHLRRGHIKRVRYGPARSFVKRQWIEPCFVNWSEGSESKRTHYNVSKRDHSTAINHGEI